MSGPLMTAWPSPDAPREFMSPRAIWYVRCWCEAGARVLPRVGWLGMHASDAEKRHALERVA